MAKSRLIFKGGIRPRDPEKMGEEFRAQLEKESGERRKVMAKPGALGLPQLLEQRRLEYGITDGAFAMQPFNDNVLVAQLYRNADECFEGTRIIMTAQAREREREQTPQGIIVAAGLCALDSLRMNGIDLGHIVGFMRMAPWRIETDMIGGKYDEVLVLRVADILGSVDLADMLRKGDMSTVFDQDQYEHHYEDADGNLWKPQQSPAFIPDNRS